MDKIINIELKDPNFEEDIYSYDGFVCTQKYPRLFSHEINNIINNFDGRKINKDEVVYALDLISLYLYQQEIYKLVVDIDERNRSLSPAKEMTLEEIEAESGHKVKIVNKKDNWYEKFCKNY